MGDDLGLAASLAATADTYKQVEQYKQASMRLEVIHKAFVDSMDKASGAFRPQ